MTEANEHADIAELRLRLEEAEETIRAIRSGAVDAFVVQVPNGARVYTLETADRPYRLLVEEMQQGAITLGDDGTIAYCNRRFADLVGRPLERLTGVAFRSFVPLEAQSIYESLLQQGRAGGSQGESHVRHADGTLVPVFLTLNALPTDCGAAVGLLVTDLTTQHHHEKLNALLEALRDADQRKNEFLAMLAHELRSPLAPIANAVQLLGLLREDESPAQQQARSIIDRQMGHLQHLVDDLLEVSRITTGKVQLRLERVAVSDIVHGAVETVRPLIEQRRHQLSVSLPPEPIWLNADAARLEQVVVNLLSNAAKYTEEAGRVELVVTSECREESGEWRTGVADRSVECRVTSGEQENLRHATPASSSPSPLATHHSPLTTSPYVVIRVRDTGVGISPSLLPRVFDLFTQAERSLDRSQGGLGIGLALVQRLTELHGGTVEASSVAGQGSEFVVRLPLMRDERPVADRSVEWRVMSGEQENLGHAPPASSSSSSSPPLATHHSPLATPVLTTHHSPLTTPVLATPLRVLIVDDNADTVLGLSMLLEAYGYDVRTACDGPTGVQAALDYLPDVALLDIGLPGLNGYEVAKRIRLEPTLKHVVLVALTGYGQDSDRQSSRQAGFNHHLVKPARLEQLQKILATVSVEVR